MKSFLRWFLGIFVGISAPGSCGTPSLSLTWPSVGLGLAGTRGLGIVLSVLSSIEISTNIDLI